jgi:hypothetical protein
MSSQAIPIGMNFSSPLGWFVIVVALIVLGLTLLTRRRLTPPRGTRGNSATAGPAHFDLRSRYAQEWSAAQARFLEDPRAGCGQAQTIVTRLLGERGLATVPDGLEQRFAGAGAIVADARSSTDVALPGVAPARDS